MHIAYKPNCPMNYHYKNQVNRTKKHSVNEHRVAKHPKFILIVTRIHSRFEMDGSIQKCLNFQLELPLKDVIF